jgi:hypothetical protein
MIDIKSLKPAHVGAWVLYKPYFGPGAIPDAPRHVNEQIGRIKSWNDKYIFVVYNCAGEWDKFADYTAAATDTSELIFIDEISCEVCPKKHSCEFSMQGGSCLPDTFLDINRKDYRDGQTGILDTGDGGPGRV